MQKRLSSSSGSGTDEKAAHLAEIARMQGALQQADIGYKQLLEQCKRRQEKEGSSHGRAVGLTELQAANKALTQDLAESHQQMVQSQRHLRQSQEQVQQYVQETGNLQQLIEKLSKAVWDMHGAVEKANSSEQKLLQKQAVINTHVDSSLQAVHNGVQRNLSRYKSNSSDCTFASSDILLPALWKPQKERHIAPTGFH